MDIKTIEREVTFQVSPKEVFDSLMDAERHAAFTGAPAEIERRSGGRFSAYGGHCGGVTVDLKADERIVQAWRAADWPEGHFSLLTYALAPLDGGRKTKVVL